jgi:hypothetical protein
VSDELEEGFYPEHMLVAVPHGTPLPPEPQAPYIPSGWSVRILPDPRQAEIDALRAALAAATVQAEQAERERDAIMAALEPLLIEVEPLRYREREAIEEACRAKREWADHYNAIRSGNDEPWVFMTEYRRSLEGQIELLSRAVWRANMVFDSIKAARTNDAD